MDTLERNEATALAAIVLAHARRGNWEASAETMTWIQHRFPDGSGIQLLMQGCADTVVSYQGLTPMKTANLELQFVNEHGKETSADDVPPAQRWAGRYVAARAVNDWDTCCALVESCASDAEYGERVGALVQVAAQTLNMVGAP